MSTFVHIECLIVIVTIECQSEVTGFLSNGDIFNYLHGTLSRFSSSWYFEDEYLSNGASYGQFTITRLLEIIQHSMGDMVTMFADCG